MIKLPSYLFTNNYQRQGNGYMQNGEISIEMRLFKYENENQNYTMSGSGLYGEPGVGPPVRVTFGGFLSHGEVKSGQIKNQYVLSILLIAGKNVDFKIFVNEFKSILKSNLSNINDYNSLINSSKKQLNENDEDGGGYISLGMELYPGSLVMSIDRAINLILMAKPSTMPIWQMDAQREIAIALAQRTSPLGANCRLFASDKLDIELKKQQLTKTEPKEDDLNEGLKFVYDLLKNNLDFYGLWMLLRLITEVQRINDSANEQPNKRLKRNNENDSIHDFNHYPNRIENLYKKCKPLLKEISETIDNDNNMWSNKNMANNIMIRAENIWE